jgi:hypothetical protein
MWPPVAVDGAQNGTYVTTVFAVGLHLTNANSGSPLSRSRAELYAKEKNGTGAWSDWIQLGNPDNAPFFTDINDVDSTVFTVDQGVRWIDGSLMRGSLFGSDSSHQLIHLFHDNNGWHWDAPVPLPQPQPPAAPIQISSRISCAVLTAVSGSPGWHLTALMRDNTGKIWNRQLDSSSGSWTWQ